MAGFVYIMSNPSFADGRIKIGKSDRDPEEFRKSELNSTGVPEPFKVEYSAYVENHHELERKIHKHFDAQRPNKNREFFTCSIMDAISAVQNFAGETLKHEDNYYAKYEEFKRQEEEKYEEFKRQEEEERKKLEAERLEAERLEAERLKKEEFNRQEKVYERRLKAERFKKLRDLKIKFIDQCREFYRLTRALLANKKAKRKIK